MRNEFTAVVERAGRWHIAYCPEIPGANGQGRTKAAALKSLANAIALILEDRRKDGLRGVPAFRRGERRSSSGEAGRPASSPATARVPFETRRAIALPLDQSDDRCG
jgi:predicted RNase H-like HicB family nuclease